MNLYMDLEGGTSVGFVAQTWFMGVHIVPGNCLLIVGELHYKRSMYWAGTEFKTCFNSTCSYERAARLMLLMCVCRFGFLLFMSRPPSCCVINIPPHPPSLHVAVVFESNESLMFLSGN